MLSISANKKRRVDTSSTKHSFTDLADALWIIVCQFLHPSERFRLKNTCKNMNNCLSLSKNKYKFFIFYNADMVFWSNYCANKCNGFVDKPFGNYIHDIFNLMKFDTIDSAILSSIKYFIIYYKQISNLPINKQIAAEHSIINQEKQHKERTDFMNFHGDFWITREFKHNNDKLIQFKLKNNLYIPNTIHSLILGKLKSETNKMIKWICDILLFCDSNCSFIQYLYLNDSNVNNKHISMMCDAIKNRKSLLNSLQYLTLSDNKDINDECINELLTVLHKYCPNIKYLSLNKTGITNKGCRVFAKFYKRFDQKFNHVFYIGLAQNISINTRGIAELNKIYSAKKMDKLFFHVNSLPPASIGFWNTNIYQHEHIKYQHALIRRLSMFWNQ